MNKEELLKAVGNIDDKYIEAAEEKRDSIAPKNKAAIGVIKSDAKNDVRIGKNNARKSNFRFGPWAKGLAAVAAAFVVLVGIGASGLLFGRAGKSAPQDAAAETEYYDAGNGYVVQAGESYAKADMPEAEYSEEKSKVAADISSSNLMVQYEAPRVQKLVYQANLYLQTENYDESFSALEKLVDELGGYFESQSVSNGNYYSSVSKSGWCCVRIPTQNYEAFMNAVGQAWHVCNKDENISDISEQYYETQDRLETLRIKEDRLHELLRDANNLSDIITLEDQLSNTEYQIEQLTNAMRGYDKQVDYSTINISLDEVTQMGNTVGSEGFGKRLVRAIKNGFRNFGEGVADFIVWMGYNVIEIIIAAVVIILIWKFHLIRKIINWIKR